MAHTRPRLARTTPRRVAVLAATALLMAACGGDDDSDQSDRGSGDTSVETTTATQPSASDTAVLRPYVEDLLVAWDEAMTPILGDPQAVVDDADSALRRDLADLFTSDSPYVEDLDELLGGYITQDTGVRPGPNGLAQTTTLLHFTQNPDEDHASFVFCSFSDGVLYSLSTGAERSPGVGVTQGAGEAARVDGVWRLHRLRQLGIETRPAGTANPCPALAEPEGD
ncbi:MAG: hypothetical protein ACRD2C_13810 [Acidimicrobiales bacterium]